MLPPRDDRWTMVQAWLVTGYVALCLAVAVAPLFFPGGGK